MQGTASQGCDVPYIGINQIRRMALAMQLILSLFGVSFPFIFQNISQDKICQHRSGWLKEDTIVKCYFKRAINSI